MITTTRLSVSTSGQDFDIPGAYTAQELVAMYGSSLPGLSEMQSSVRENGNTRVVTFSPRQGSKG